jgi:hypothetical protein
LKNPRPPLFAEASNLILKHIIPGIGGGGGNRNPPPVNPWVEARYGPLNLPQNTHDLLENYLKLLPKYDGEKTLIVEEHMVVFQDFTENLFIEHDDVFKILFVQTIKGDVRKWFRGLPRASINTWQVLETTFMRKWGENRDNLYYLT